ncbi:MAG: biotin synthase BioB [Candidatus Hydrogenedentota bacterium]|nr:MAG: biotin synthase BioB [Candidatus Hydrogenedentota bacterium]
MISNRIPARLEETWEEEASPFRGRGCIPTQLPGFLPRRVMAFSGPMKTLSRDEIVDLLSADRPHFLELLEEARKMREKHYDRFVTIHILSNAKSGRCSEDCGFCSQSARYSTAIETYPLLKPETLLEQASNAAAAGAEKFCIVTATRAATRPLLDKLCPTISTIKKTFPHLKICTSLGLLTPEAAQRLKEAGADRYNHNLETSERFFPNLVTTHSWTDRVRSVEIAKTAGLETCCGGLVGIGETKEDIADWLLALHRLDVDSIPINLFDPRPGTPYASVRPLSATEALRILALARLVHPHRDIRCAGGREKILGPLQPLALFAVNSIFSNGYLTTPGQGLAADREMIRAVGYQIREIREKSGSERIDENTAAPFPKTGLQSTSTSSSDRPLKTAKTRPEQATSLRSS